MDAKRGDVAAPAADAGIVVTRVFDAPRAFGGHGVPRVHREVHYDLFDVAFVRFYRPGVRGKLGADGYLFSDEAAYHEEQIAYDPVYVERDELERLSPAEEQELPGEP